MSKLSKISKFFKEGKSYCDDGTSVLSPTIKLSYNDMDPGIEEAKHQKKYLDLQSNIN